MPPLSDDAAIAWARLVRVSGAILSKVESDLKSEGFPPLVWYDVLLELERARTEGLRPFQLQENMLLAQYNLSRLFQRLVKAGYIKRESCSDDGRGQVLRISQEGRKLRLRMWRVYQQAIKTHFANKLDPEEITILSDLLMKLR